MFYENKTAEISVEDRTGGTDCLKFPLHMHYHAEIVYLKEGRATAVVDGREYTLGSDSLLVVFPNRTHSYISHGNEKYMMAVISPNIMPEISQLFEGCEPKTPIIENISSYPELFKTAELLLCHPTSDKPFTSERSSIVRRGYAIALLGQIFKHLSVERRGAECSRAMRAVTDYCVQNYNRELSLALLAEELHMSKYYISHLFGKEFNMKFNDYVNSLRVSAACRLLCDTEKSITEISGEVGFATPRTFNRAFSKQYKLSPTEYRNSSRKQD